VRQWRWGWVGTEYCFHGVVPRSGLGSAPITLQRRAARRATRRRITLQRQAPGARL